MKVLLLIFFFFTSSALLAETKGYLKIEGKNEVVAGDIVEATIELYPASIEYFSQLGSLVGSRVLDNFYLYKLEKVYPSPNNFEYIIAKVKLIPLVSNPRGFSLFQVGDRNIPIEIKFEIKDIQLKEGQGFHTWKIESKLNALIKFLVKYKIGFLLSLFMLMSCLLMLFLKVKKKKREAAKKVFTNWREKKSRQELEELFFIVKNNSIESLEDPPPKEILNLIENNMYKREWPQEAFEKIDNIKGGQ